jgi:hypothetical protein
MKVDKVLFDYGIVPTDVYFAFTYFPPCGSSYYKRYDCDLFYEIEQQISHYMSLGKVCVFGDFNSRTKSVPDYIVADRIHVKLQ